MFVLPLRFGAEAMGAPERDISIESIDPSKRS
jgi:hypothetical protein